MKKRAAFLLAGMMTMGAVIPVNATTDTDDQKKTTLTYEEPNDWTITIPSTVALSADKTVSANITASKMNIRPGESLKVSIASGITGGKVILKMEDNTEISSEVRLKEDGKALQSDTAVVAIFEGQNTTAKEGGTLYFSPLGDNLKAGTYEGTITFLIEAKIKTGVTIDPSWGDTTIIEF